MSSGSAATGFGEEYARIGRGGLASSTTARLDALTGWGGFSSFMSASALAVAADADVTPVAQVVGFAGGDIRRGVIRTTRPGQGRLRIGTARWRERSGPVQSWAGLRRRALGRLSQQAALLGANAVVGIRAERRVERPDRTLDEVGELGRWQFLGTAVRVGGLRTDTPVLTLASAAELWALLRAGLAPAGVAGGFASVETLLSRQSMAATRRSARRPNVELGDLTEAAYEVRRLAMERLQADARTLGADGLIGVELHLDGLDGPRVGPCAPTLSVHVLATAVRRVRPRSVDPTPVLGLSDGARD